MKLARLVVAAGIGYVMFREISKLTHKFPLPGGAWKLTSPYGMRKHPIYGDDRFHTGVDLAAETGTPVFAPDSGTVVWATSNDPIDGIALAIETRGGLEWSFSHLSYRNVSAGDEVKAGEQIGAVGTTGRSTGPHLHLQVARNGKTVNPAAYLSGLRVA